MLAIDVSSPSILVVDDNIEALNLLEHSLGKAGFTVRTALSGEDALHGLARYGLPSLAIVDYHMPPGMTGFELCRHVLQFCDLPIIMLTAMDEEAKIIEAITKFSEDYVIKPYNSKELIARIRRVLHRVGQFPYAPAVPIEVDDFLRVDFPNRQVVAGTLIKSLTPTEARLLYVLMRERGEVVATDYLLRRLWPDEVALEDRLHVHVHRLRGKLKDRVRKHAYVISERGAGYRFQAAV